VSTAAESQASGIDSGKQHEIAALPVLTPGALRRAERNHTSGGQRSEISLSGGGGGQSQPSEDTNLPETQMAEMAALPLERPTQIDTSARHAVVTGNNYVRAVSSGIGIGRGGGIGSGYGQSIGNSFGGFISGLRRSGLSISIAAESPCLPLATSCAMTVSSSAELRVERFHRTERGVLSGTE
jgi:hypothetical protein